MQIVRKFQQIAHTRKGYIHAGRHRKSLSEMLANVRSPTHFGGAKDDTAYAMLSCAVQHVSRCNIIQSLNLPLDCHVVGQFADEPIEVGCVYNPIPGSVSC